jgi:hypothetical protein
VQAIASPGRELLEAGRLAEARPQLWTEALAAEARGDTVAFADAALGLGGIWVHEHRSTLELARVTDLQRRALAALDPDHPLARRLCLRLAAETAYTTADGDPVLAELASVRAHDDPVALAEGLSLAHHCLLGPHFGPERLSLADELVHVAMRTGRAIDELMGLAWRTVDLVLAGDSRACRSLQELRERLVERRCDGLAYLVAALDVTAAMRAGRLDDAEALATACLQLGLGVGDADALGWYGAQLVAIRWLQGRGGEVLTTVVELAQSPTVAELNPGFQAAIAALAAACGEDSVARSALAGLRAPGLAELPPSSSWLSMLLGACDAAFALGDAEAAAEAYELLEPFASLPVMASLGVACFGSAHRPLALAAWTMGDLERAIGHLDAALAADLRLGHQPCQALDAALLAEALERRRAGGDVDRARELWTVAIEGGRACGMHERVLAWERAAARTTAGDATCRREGRVWSVTVDERTALVPDSVGMRYLAQLIERAGTPIAALELASGHALAARGATAQPLLDAEARSAYRRRVGELEAEVDDADASADPERAARARAELDRLVDELARCSGLAGRSRSFAHDAERARVSVHKAIKRAVRVLVDVEPAVGRAIGARVVTGTTCVFLARPPEP